MVNVCFVHPEYAKGDLILCCLVVKKLEAKSDAYKQESPPILSGLRQLHKDPTRFLCF